MQLSLPVYLIVSGLPASGKSSIAQQLQQRLGLPLLDKDTILDSLNANFRTTNAEQRRHVSTGADDVFVAVAEKMGQGVLCTFWNHPASTTTPGTDTQWLHTSSAKVIEIYCHCPAQVAYDRIQIRQQKLGKPNNSRPNLGYDLLSEYKVEADLGPLKLGDLDHVITVKTDQPVNVDRIVQQIETLINP